MDKTQFRLDFPEFANPVTYDDAQLDFWAGIAESLVRENVWGDTRPFAVKLYVAHEITLATQNLSATKSGGSPGQQGGIANNKTVGSVTVGYDASTTTEKDAGWWNLTNYGKQFIRLARLFGAGAIQL